MFSHLKSRLWLTYSIMIIVMICVLGIGITYAVSTNPVFFRMEVDKLRLAQQDPRIDDPDLFRNETARTSLIEKLAIDYQVRVVLLDSSGSILKDSSDVQSNPLRIVPGIQNQDNSSTIRTIRDRTGRVWFYVIHVYPKQGSIIFAIRRPAIALRILVRDEIFQPMLLSGILALIASLLISFVLGNWILNPLVKIAHAAKISADGDYQPIPLDGPQEVQELASTLNEMNLKINNSLLSQRNFMANVSHELKTPLTSIQGYAQAIKDGTADSPQKIASSAGIIFSEAERMTKLVTDLLSLAKLEGGTADLHLKIQPITSIIDATVDRLKPQALKKMITLSSNAMTQVDILCDSDRMIQVFSNLIENAIKYSPSGSAVIVSTKIEKEYAVISISDRGPGIPDHELTKIFDRFYQSDKIKSSDGDQGFGLGLTIARQIVEAHKGKIWVENNPDAGCTFFVALPVS